MKIWLGLLALGVILWLLIDQTRVFIEMVWVILGSLFLGLTMRPAADRFQKKGIPRSVTILVIYALFALLVVGGAYLAFPLIDDELAQLQEGAPAALETMVDQLQDVPIIGDIVPSVEGIARSVEEDGVTALSLLGNIASRVGRVATDVAAVIFLGYFVAARERFATRLIQYWTREQERSRIDWLVDRVEIQLSRWVLTQVVISIYYMAVSYAGLRLFGVPYPLLISIVGGLLEIVPYLGTLGVILAVISAATVRPLLAIWVLIYSFATCR